MTNGLVSFYLSLFLIFFGILVIPVSFIVRLIFKKLNFIWCFVISIPVTIILFYSFVTNIYIFVIEVLFILIVLIWETDGHKLWRK